VGGLCLGGNVVNPGTSLRADRRRLILAMGALATGCVTPPRPGDDAAAGEGWHDVPFPGKRRTEYRWEKLEGERVLTARARASASMYRRRLAAPQAAHQGVSFGWWVQTLPEGGDVGAVEASDAAARVMFAFGGDVARLSARNQLLFDLARTLTGEVPPYATLSYVWDVAQPVGSVVIHPRSDRLRKIVVESGPQGLRQWRSYRRSLAADYRRVFAEEPGPLLAVAVMTDGDNTGSTLTTRYRDIHFG
jgi:Protein of unknown function (DUF3047)